MVDEEFFALVRGNYIPPGGKPFRRCAALGEGLCQDWAGRRPGFPSHLETPWIHLYFILLPDRYRLGIGWRKRFCWSSQFSTTCSKLYKREGFVVWCVLRYLLKVWIIRGLL